MKKILFLILLSVLLGCSKHQVRIPVAPVEPPQESAEESAEERDSALRDWPFPGAKGNWIPSRDGLENSDTIVNGFPYNRV